MQKRAALESIFENYVRLNARILINQDIGQLKV